MKLSFWHPVSLIATFFGLGKIPVAPGTFGTFGGLLVAYLNFSIYNYFQFQTKFYVPYSLVLLFLIEFAIGTICAHIYAKSHGDADPQEVVIDEVMGYLLSIYMISPIFLLSGMAGDKNNYLKTIITSLVVSFIIFRLFDIFKPGPIGWCDRNIKGGFGIMFDDILAGFCAGIVSYVVLAIISLL